MEREKNLAAFLAGNHVDVPKTLLHVTNKDVSSFSANNGIAAWAAGKEFADDFARSKFSYWKAKHLPWEKQPAPPNQDGKPWLNYMPVHISAKKPFDARKLIPDLSETLTDINQINTVAKKLNIDPKEIFNSIDKTNTDSMGRQTPRKLLAADILNNQTVLNRLREMGHDSLIAHEFDNPVFAVFDPSQIKSAIGNQGTYDPNNLDITKAEGGSVDDDGITAYHGSPHDFDRFDISKIGTGEGAQAFGHGLYFAESEPVAKSYKDKLAQMGWQKDGAKMPMTPNALADMGYSRGAISHFFRAMDISDGDLADALHHVSEGKKYHRYGSSLWNEYDHAANIITHLMGGEAPPKKVSTGRMYEVHIAAHPDHFLDWDKPLAEQAHVINAIDQHIGDPETVLERLIGHQNGTGQDLYNALGGKHKAEAVSQKLNEMGIKGVKYLDRGSRLEGEGSRNYVVFDDKLVTTKRKYARGGVVTE